MFRHFSARARSAAACMVCVVAYVCATAEARNNIRSAFFAAYPGAVGSRLDDVPSHPAHCGVCHYDFSGGGSRNPYGSRIEAALPGYASTLEGRRLAILSIQNIDADNDGYSSLVEITDLASFSNTPTFPGLTPALLSGVRSVALTDIQNYLLPVHIPNTTGPTVRVTYPNGGESIVANVPVTVRWTATDPSGVALARLYLSLDGGATYAPVALDIEPTGSFEWFPPNRPTTQARFRVVALDFLSNPGEDQSDGVFSITRPGGGLLPSTLRDFDLPGSQPFEVSSIAAPADCVGCHGGYDPAVEPYRNWAGSMMAHASIDPLFEACLTIANQDAPESGDLCLRCHIPTGWLAGRSTPTSGARMLTADKTGISCDLCHRMVDPIYQPGRSPLEDVAILADLIDAPTVYSNGMFVIDPIGTRRGPYGDADMVHTALQAGFFRDAAFCGTCHDVSNPALERAVDGRYLPNPFDQPAGSVAATHLMPLERTYSEWLNSAYNTPTGVLAPQFGGNRTHVSTCQHCHMRAVTGRGCTLPDAPLRTDLPLHDMTGGSTWLPGLLPTISPSTTDADAIAAGIVRARYLLQNAAELAVTQADDRLVVRVQNNTGHKLPTGYPEGRRMWLNVRFYDRTDSLMAESAAYNPMTGVLTLDPQALIFEAKPGLDETTAPLVGATPGPAFHFALVNKIFKDNRIPPRGFSNAAYSAFGGAPVGASYADGQYWHDADYAIPPTAARVEVRLYYQSASKEYIEFLRDANTTDTRGQFMYDLWAANGKCPPELMVSATRGLVSTLTGDVNCDGRVDFDDIDPFVVALTGPLAYAAAYPDCNYWNADANGDESVDFDDIDAFVTILSGG